MDGHNQLRYISLGRIFTDTLIRGCTSLQLAGSKRAGKKKDHTKWDIVVHIERNLLSSLNLIDALQNGKAVPNTIDAHFFQFIVLQRDERLAHDTIFCKVALANVVHDRIHEISPRKDPQYCSRPREVKNSEHSSAVHSDMIDRGVRGPSLE